MNCALCIGLSLALSLATAACAGRITAGPNAPSTAVEQVPVAGRAVDLERDCLIGEAKGDPIRSVALTDAVDAAHAPYPTNDSERLLFVQLYETLVRIDCDGNVRPALAASWRRDSDRSWTFELRDARFSDGTPVRAADVVAAWNTGGWTLPARAAAQLETASAAGDSTVRVTTRSGGDDAVRALASTDLAVTRGSGAAWPLGTTGWRVAAADGPGPRGALMLVGAGDGAATPAAIRVVLAPDRDRRDVLDEGVDLLVTSDRATLEYAATQPGLETFPLPWQRVHVFLSPWRLRDQAPLTVENRQALAIDAVRGAARGAEAPFWWQDGAGCDVPRPDPRTLPPIAGGRVVFDAGDAASRELAERFVGVARAPDARSSPLVASFLPPSALRGVQSATGLAPDALVTSLFKGADVGYVLSLDRAVIDRCPSLGGLAARVPWLDPDAMLPLVDTRASVVLRRGRRGVAVQWDGSLLLAANGH